LGREGSVFVARFLGSLSDIELGTGGLLTLDPICEIKLPGGRGEFGRFEDGFESWEEG